MTGDGGDSSSLAAADSAHNRIATSCGQFVTNGGATRETADGAEFRS